MAETVTGQCLNCGEDLNGLFCSACGQKDADPNLSLGTMLSEFAGGFFSFDSRIYRTWKHLITRPGQLTADYIAGRRASQVPPFKLYLFTTILAIFLLSLVDTGMFKVNLTKGAVPPPAKQTSQAPQVEPLEASESPDDGGAPTNTPQTGPATEKEPALDKTGGSFLRRLGGKFREGMRRGQEDPQKVSKLMVQAIPKAMFLLLPLFALLLRVFYLKHRFNYPHWFIFSLHFHTFGFFFMMAGALFFWVELKLVLRALILTVPPAYLFLSLRRLTGERWWLTLIKLFFFSLLYFLVITIAMLMIAFWTLITF